jgi:hypothetical protein
MALDLVFDGKTFPVPKKSVFELFEHNRELFEAPSYAVQSSVPLEVFEAFVASLNAQTKILVTNTNVVFLRLLANEFFLPELAAECGAFPVTLDQFLSLSERVSQLERADFSVPNRPDRIEERIERQEQELESVGWAVDTLRAFVDGALKELKSEMRRPPPTPKPSAAPAPAASQKKVEIPLKADKSLDGVISYLTKQHGGNVHDKGIVTITSKSIFDESRWSLRNVADLSTDLWFWSKDEPGQWICWDFHEMGIRPTNYTIRARWLKSWVVEGSVDHLTWVEIDRKTENDDFMNDVDPKIASFAVTHSVECRFLRLTQIDNGPTRDPLCLWAVEFFGRMCE